jgi:hypothetical protein
MRTLVWDRLPDDDYVHDAVFAVVIGEHIDANAGLRLLAPLLVVGAASVLYWRILGDLRPLRRGAVSAIAALAPDSSALSFPSDRRWISLGTDRRLRCSKAVETADQAIFAWGQLVSGHTLKHLSAGLGMAIFSGRDHAPPSNEHACGPCTSAATDGGRRPMMTC